MDDSLLNNYIDDALLPLYPNIAKHASFDASTGKQVLAHVCFEQVDYFLVQ
jgi:hypothetical protein